MKRFLIYLSAVVLAAAPMHAQDLGVGMEVSGFRVPDYDDEGNLRALLQGGHARVQADGAVEITNLRIELYRDGAVMMTLFAPRCFFNADTRRAESDGLVLIESDMMTVTGRGFIWSADAGRFEILHDARVMVKPAARRQVEELNP